MSAEIDHPNLYDDKRVSIPGPIFLPLKDPSMQERIGSATVLYIRLSEELFSLDFPFPAKDFNPVNLKAINSHSSTPTTVVAEYAPMLTGPRFLEPSV